MFIDTHAHLYLDQFSEDIDQVLVRAKESKVEKILLPNIDCKTYVAMMDLVDHSGQYCLPMAGLHPCSVGPSWAEDLDQLARGLEDDRVVGIGETGIDLYWDTTYRGEQEEAFRRQLSWSKEYGLPVVIHSRKSLDLTLQIVAEEQDGSLKGVFHCFTEGPDYARRVVDTGLLMGIGGVLTYKKSDPLRESVSFLSPEYFILETDSPYLPPVPYRGKRNESSYLVKVAEVMSGICGLSIEETAQITTDNARRLFGLD